MSASSRVVLGLAGALILAVPAHAANEQSPGTLKKQIPTTSDVMTPQTPTVAPAPTPQTSAPKTDSGTQAKSDVKAPVNKGTAKKLGTAPTSASPTTTTTTAATTTRSRTRAAQRATTRRQAARRAAAHRARSRAAARRRRAAPATAATPDTDTTSQAAAAAPVARTDARRSGRRHASAAPAGAAKAAASNDDPAPLTSLSRAADHVIEVIPGSVILALAGLVALVLLLIMRSLTVERQRGRALATSYGVTVEALATAIEAKDHTTGGHIERVRRLGLLLASEIVPREARDPQMAYGFLLHDIGKLAVPDSILRAPGRLTEEEWALMRRHPEEGVRMLSHVPFLDKALDVVRHHHERWDGGGYPAGLAGEQIPLWARIFSVVDALDAITAERPYRAARTYESALAEIRRHAGTQFDPDVVATLEALDPSVVAPLLEPTQLVEPLEALPELSHIQPLVA